MSIVEKLFHISFRTMVFLISIGCFYLFINANYNFFITILKGSFMTTAFLMGTIALTHSVND